MVEYDEAKVTPTSLTETVAKAGDMYKVSDMKIVDAFSTQQSKFHLNAIQTVLKKIAQIVRQKPKLAKPIAPIKQKLKKWLVPKTVKNHAVRINPKRKDNYVI